MRPGLLGTVECRIGGEVRPAVRTTPEAIDIQRALREMLDAGDRSCVMEATSHGSELRRLDRIRFDALVFTNLTQDHLDFHGTMERYFEAKRRLFLEGRPPAAINSADEWGRRLLRDRPDALDVRIRAGRADRPGCAGRSRPQAARSVQRRERAWRARRREAARCRRGGDGRAGSRQCPGCRAGSSRWTRGSPSRSWSTTRTRPTRSRTCCARRATSPKAASSVSSAAAATATAASARSWAASHRGWPMSQSSRPTIPAARSRRRSSRRSSPGWSQGPRSIPTGGARSRRAIELAEPGDVVVIAGKGHEQGQEFKDGRQGAVRRPGGGARGASEAESRRDRARRRRGRRSSGSASWPCRSARRRSRASRSTPGGSSTATFSCRSATGARSGDDAFARGAAATLVPDDAFAAMAALGRTVRSRSSARVVAITGSYGKTTTKDILASIAIPQRPTVAAERSFNNEIGVPLTLCRLEPETEICITELAMRGFGQIAELAELTRPEIGVVVTIGPVHLEKVGSLEGVVRAKSELIEALPPGGTAIVPADFPVPRDDLDVVRIGEDVRVESFDPPHLRTTLGEVEVSFAARHLAVNGLCALAAARALGLELPAPPRRRVRRLAQPRAGAPRRRTPDQRRLERESDLDAGGARASARARRRPSHRGRPRGDGGAGRLRAGRASRGCRVARRRRPGPRDRGRVAGARVRRPLGARPGSRRSSCCARSCGRATASCSRARACSSSTGWPTNWCR